MAQFVRISHDMTDDAPCWPGTPKLVRRQFTSVDKGDVSNTCDLLLFNHFGTHLDAPNHFNPAGLTLDKVPVDRFIYQRPLLLDIPKGDRELVTRQELEVYANQLRDCDLLLIRGGWGGIRRTEPSRYALEGPGISPEACSYLVEEFPRLKALGMDFISLAAYRKADPEGVAAHQILCGMHNPGRYVIILEDVNLEALPQSIGRVFALPLFAEGIDGGPCTIVAEVND